MIENTAVNFENICFAYHKRAKTSSKVFSFSINGGEKVAVVGSSGSGKINISLNYSFAFMMLIAVK